LDATNIKSPNASPLFDQLYKLKITNASGCTDIDSVMVSVNDTAQLDFSYTYSPRCVGAVLEIQNNSLVSDQYTWLLNGDVVSTDKDPEFTIDHTIENTVTLMGGNSNCGDSISKIIPARSFREILNFSDANVFTPNGDGINDFFQPGIVGEFKGCVRFRIYDRWGAKVLDSDNGQYTWDGRNQNGKVAARGMYYYIIDVAGEEIRGSIFLSR